MQCAPAGSRVVPSFGRSCNARRVARGGHRNRRLYGHLGNGRARAQALLGSGLRGRPSRSRHERRRERGACRRRRERRPLVRRLAGNPGCRRGRRARRGRGGVTGYSLRCRRSVCRQDARLLPRSRRGHERGVHVRGQHHVVRRVRRRLRQQQPMPSGGSGLLPLRGRRDEMRGARPGRVPAPAACSCATPKSRVLAARAVRARWWPRAPRRRTTRACRRGPPQSASSPRGTAGQSVCGFQQATSCPDPAVISTRGGVSTSHLPLRMRGQRG